jgi:cytochrome c oxidase subunit 4
MIAMSEEHHPETPETHITASPHGEAEIHAGHEAHGPSLKTYFVIFGALTCFTLISFVANYFAHQHVISHFTSFAIILGVAVCKATLVGMYFMHLVVDWGKVFIIIVPALILGPMLMIVLLPDIVLAWRNISP